MPIYYIPIPTMPKQQAYLDNLLNGLSQYYELSDRSYIQIQTSSPELDPIFSKLADHIVRPDAPPATAAEPLPEPEPEKRNNGQAKSKVLRRIYQVEGSGEPLTRPEITQLLESQAIPPGTRVQMITGKKPLFFVSKDYLLVKEEAPMH